MEEFGGGPLPLYEYRCRKCGAQFEKIRKFSDPALTKCEKCGSELEQLLSSPAIRFKGSGFYVTDYAKKSGDGGDGSGEKKTEKPAATESKTESKKPSQPTPATKPDKK
jgi:putative FmdB family regulatory protein